MPIQIQLLKKWVGLDPEKHIGSTPLVAGGSRRAGRRVDVEAGALCLGIGVGDAADREPGQSR